jgi:hypothetical protein
MKIEIRIGDTSTNKRVHYRWLSIKDDDTLTELKQMYNFLEGNNDCIIEDVDNFLLYGLSNGIMAYSIKDNPNIEEDEVNRIPKLNPQTYRVFEIKEDGSEVYIQDKDGLVSENYFDNLMGAIMKDFYTCLNYYK